MSLLPVFDCSGVPLIGGQQLRHIDRTSASCFRCGVGAVGSRLGGCLYRKTKRDVIYQRPQVFCGQCIDVLLLVVLI